MPRRPATALLLAVLLAGCGAGGSSAGDFEGEERRVAQVVEDLQSAAEGRDGAEVCSRLLATRFADALAADGRTCAQEVDKALEDAESASLEVEAVRVTGAEAVAQVKDADDRVTRLPLVRERGGWRLTAFGG